MATPQPFGREMTNREFFIRRWEQEYPAFVKVFKALPADQLDYRPEPRARSAGELLALLVGIEGTGNELCEKGEIHWEDPKGFGKWDEMIAAYEQYHEALGKGLRQLDEATWNKRSQCWEHGHVEIEDTVGGLPLFLLPPRSPKLKSHVERSHRTHHEEFYQVIPNNWSVDSFNPQLRCWEQIYNTVGPHQALRYLTPLEFLERWKSQQKKAECH